MESKSLVDFYLHHCSQIFKNPFRMRSVLQWVMQISAESPGTRQLLERYSRAHGVKKQFLIERALLHHIQALEELPTSIIIPPRLVVSAASGRKIAELVTKRQKPTSKLVELTLLRIDPRVPGADISLDLPCQADDLLSRAAHHSRIFMPEIERIFCGRTAAPYQPLYEMGA